MQHIRLGPAMFVVLFAALLVGSVATGQPYYYETTFVGVNIPVGGANCGVVSVQETFPGGLSGLFIDYTWLAGDAPAQNTAAALDMNWWFRPPNFQHPNWGPIYPTGNLAVARSQGALGGNVIAFYQQWNNDLNWQTTQYQNFAGPQGPTWTIPAVSGNPVMAMEIANGFPVAGAFIAPTDFLITAENINGFVFLGAYALTNGAGAIVQPALVSATATNLPGTVVGMAIAVGNINPVTGERTQNEIVFAVHYPQINSIWLHSITFDIRTAAFGALDPGVGSTYGITPFNLSAATNGSQSFGGISIARNWQSTFGGGLIFNHDVAVSMGHWQSPNGQPGDVLIFPPNPGGAAIPPIQMQGVGGSHICHVPGADLVAGQYWGTANATFNFPPIGGPPPGPFGWFVVTPGAQYSIVAIDAAGAVSPNFLYLFPQGATPNGPPMSHPGGESIMGLRGLRPGPLWIPYVLGGVPWIDFVESQFIWNGPAGAVPHVVAGANFPGQPNLLKLGQAWPVQSILRGVAFLNEYGLYLRGY